MIKIRNNGLWLGILIGASILIRLSFAARYPIKMVCYPDELRYYRIATSIANGTGLSIYNMPTDFQKILYSVCIAPACLVDSIRLRMILIFAINSIIMSLGTLAVYSLASKMLKSSLLKFVSCIFYLISSNMLYTMTFMSENLSITITLFLMDLIYSQILNEMNFSLRDILISLLSGFVCYLCYLTKEVAIVVPLAYLAYIISMAIYRDISSTKISKDKQRVIIIKYMVFLLGFSVPYIIMKMTLFNGMSNSYSQQVLEAIMALRGPDKIQYLAYGIVCYIVNFSIMILLAPLLIPIIHFDSLDNQIKKYFVFLLWIIIGTAVIVSYTITIREDYFNVGSRFEPRAHMRYIAALEPILIIILFNLLEKRFRIDLSNMLNNNIIICIITFGVGALYRGFSVGSNVDNYMYIFSKFADNGNMLFIITISIAIITIAIESLMKYNIKSAVFLFVLLFSVTQICDNYYGIKDNLRIYSISDHIENEAIGLKSLIDNNQDKKYLIVDSFLTDEQKTLDTYLTQKNVYVTSIDEFKSLYASNADEMDQKEVSVIWTNGENIKYPKMKYDYLILRKGNFILNGAECAMMKGSAYKDYNVYEISGKGRDISLIEGAIISNKNNSIMFWGDNWNANWYILSGISGREQNFTWTNEREIRFKDIYMEDSKGRTKYSMHISIAGTFNGDQRINISNNGRKVYSDKVNGGANIDIVVETDDKGILRLVFEVPDLISPHTLGVSNDDRELGIALDKITFAKAK